MKFQLLTVSKIMKNNNDLPRLKHWDVAFILLINDKMPTLVGI